MSEQTDLSEQGAAESAADGRILSVNSSETHGSVDEESNDTFLSPRTMINKSKENDEELTVTKTKVDSRRRYFEEKLPHKKPMSEGTRRVLSRHSLPAGSTLPPAAADGPSSRSSLDGGRTLGSREEIMARARAALDDRKKSKEAAKARVSAAMESIRDETGVSISESVSSVKTEDDASVGGNSVMTSNTTVRTRAANSSLQKYRDVIERKKKREAQTNQHLKEPPKTGKAVDVAVDESASKAGNVSSESLPTTEATGASDVSTIEKTTEEKNEVKAKAQERLNAAMALLSKKGTPLKGTSASSRASPLVNHNRKPLAGSEQKKPVVEASDSDLERQIEAKSLQLDQKKPVMEASGSDLERQLEAKSRQLEQARGGEWSSEGPQGIEGVGSDESDARRPIQSVEENSWAAEATKRAEIQRLAEEQTAREANEARQAAHDRAQRLENARLQAEATRQAELERLRMERAQKEADEAQAEEERRQEQERLQAEAAKQAELDEQAKRAAEEGRQRVRAEAERVERERLAGEATAHELERLEGAMGMGYGRTPRASGAHPVFTHQGSTSFDQPIAHNSSSYSADPAELNDRPSDDTDATSLSSIGQVDRMLFHNQDKHKPVRKHSDYSQPAGSEDGDIGSFNESGSQSSQIEMANISDLGSPLSPGPMWKKAAEEAAIATSQSALTNDLLPRDSTVRDSIDVGNSPSLERVPTNGSRKAFSDKPSRSNYDYDEEDDQDTDGWEQEQDMDVEEDDRMGLREWKGFNRGRSTFMVGIGVLGGLLPSLYSLNTCHFVTGDLVVGEDDEEFDVYYGLQKFSPVDSIFEGHRYCKAYDGYYSYTPPSLPRTAGVCAVMFGIIPLIVIGVYLRFSMTNETYWYGSMWMLYLGFICQCSTLSIFLVDVCNVGVDCSMGPGAKATIMASVVWFILSIEMKLNSPLIQAVNVDGFWVVEKEWAIVTKIKHSWQKFKMLINDEDRRAAPSLSKAAMKKKKGRVGSSLHSEKSSYRPPDIV